MSLREYEVLAVTERIEVSCPEEPERFDGAPLGMYHCPNCGCMQMAGLPHFPHEEYCWLGLWNPVGESE